MSRTANVMHDVLSRHCPPGVEWDDFLARLVNEHGQRGAAEYLGCKFQSLHYWMMRLGITYNHVATTRRERVEIVRMA